MGKLSCYVLNNVLYGEGLHNYYGMTRKGWYFMNKHVYETIRLHLMYSFEDRNDEGYSINDLIWYFENTRDILRFNQSSRIFQGLTLITNYKEKY